MFDTLLETKKKSQRGFGGAFGSVFFHGAAIAFAVWATSSVGQAVAKEQREEAVKLIDVKKPPPPEVKPPPPDVVHAPPPPKGFQILTAPVEIPDVLPQIDLSKKMTDEADFSGKGAVGGTSKGVEGGTPRPLGETTYLDFQVEKVAKQIEGVGNPTYPDQLKQAGIEGEVLASFTIDTTGKAEVGTFKVLKSSHALFTEAVKAALPKMRFLPAEIAGHKVRESVQLPFNFTIH
jgi:protein TonB